MSVVTIDTAENIRECWGYRANCALKMEGRFTLMNRGNWRENIFWDELERERSRGTLNKSCRKTQHEVQAYCLMRDHFYLVIGPARSNLVTGMKWLLGCLYEVVQYPAHDRLKTGS